MDRLADCLSGLVHDRGTLGQAWFSTDREHRFMLLRGGELDDETPLFSFIMLNPSTADADQNDPTIAKCIKFAAKFALDHPAHRVAIANLFAVRATDPDVAFAHPRPVGGQKNDDVIAALADASQVVIAAWGSDKRSERRAREVYRSLRDRVVLHRLGGPSKFGYPKHPLYLKDSTELEVHSW